MRIALPLLALVTALAGCPGSSGDASSVPQALDACLTRWWRTYYGACDIMQECSGATGDLQQACAADDCRGMVFIGYRGNGTDVDGTAIWSATQSLLCTNRVQTGTWSLVDAGHIEITFGALPPETIPATCAGSGAEVNGQTLFALPGDVSAALESRASTGSWGACAY